MEKPMRRVAVYTSRKEPRSIKFEAVFHGLFQEGSNGDTEPVAVVEKSDGALESWPIEHIKFLEPLK